MEDRERNLLERFIDQKTIAEAVVDDWAQTKLKENPFEALNWGGGIFRTAARITVLGMAIDFLQASGTVPQLVEYMHDFMFRGAQKVETVSGVTSRLCERELVAAYADLWEELQRV